MRHKWQNVETAIQLIVEKTGIPFELKPCPHCNHLANLVGPVKSRDTWGGYDWEIVCSSSHCRARVVIVCDGWYEELDSERNPHIPKDELYRDRVTDLKRMWNRRIRQ